jgi:hypothetical protein
MSALTAPVDREARRILVAAEPPLNGIEFVEVLSNHAGTPGHIAGAPQQRTLLVHLLRSPVPAGLDATRVQVLGGVRPDPRINPVRVEWTRPAGALGGLPAADVTLIENAVPAARRPFVLAVRTSSSGDWSTYVLRLLGAGGVGVPAGFDEPLASATFRFTVDCPSDLDCRVETECPPVPPSSPAVDYLARDYTGLRTRLLDRLATLLGGWSDTNPADPLVTLAELFAYSGDRLTYWQDAVATEAYLTTARRRSSVRRHARLLDYRMHDGCAARTWLAFAVEAPVDLPRRTPVAAGAARGADLQPALESGATVFETVSRARLLPARNALALHAWGDTDACLPAGSTGAYVRHPAGADPELAAGDVLVLGPADGLELVGDERRRCAVRLTADPEVRDDPLAPGEVVLELRWGSDDALAVPLPISARTATGDAQPTAAALGNVVLAEHAASLAPQDLEPAQVPTDVPYRPRLATGGVAWVDETPDSGSAAAALRPDPRRARPQVVLDDGTRVWDAQVDLLASGRLDPHFVVESESAARIALRFGGAGAGLRPTELARFSAHVRVGGGPEGNVGPDVLTAPLATALGPPPGGVTAVSNPLPAIGGAAPERLEAVRELAPHAFRRQLRAVTSADYAAAANEHPGVQRAVARRRWTGSWYAQEVTLDVVAARAGDEIVGREVGALLDVRRLAGVDVELAPPQPVPLEIVLGICVAAGHLRADVARALSAELSAGTLPDGRHGFFHPDEFTFGQPLLLSDLVARVMAVPGVAWVDVDDDADTGLRFRRLGRRPDGEVAAGRIAAAAREVLRADSDPSNPENGRVGLIMRGGT